MFEVPDDEDAFWDEFSLEDDTNYLSASESVINKCDYSERVIASKPKILVEDSDLSAIRHQKEHFQGPGENNKAGAEFHFGQGNSKMKDDVANGHKSLKRKFPGPAGLLPPSMEGESGKNSPVLIPALQTRSALDHSDFQTPQEHTDLFSSSPWKTLLSDLGSESQLVLDQFSIKSMLVQAGRKRLPKGKIPLIVGVIDSLTYQGADASLVIRDPSGKMGGSLHRDLVKDPESALQAGASIVLRQVSVISPSPRTHYLNITPRNVVLVYSVPKEDCVVKSSWASLSSLQENRTVSGMANLPCLRQIVKASEEELAALSRPSLQNPFTMHSSLANEVRPKLSGQWRAMSKPSSSCSDLVSAGMRRPYPSTSQVSPACRNILSSNFAPPLLSESNRSTCSMTMIQMPRLPSAACGSGSVSATVTSTALQIGTSFNADEFPDDDDDDLLQLCDTDMENGITVDESTSRQKDYINQENYTNTPNLRLERNSEQSHRQLDHDLEETVQHSLGAGVSSVFDGGCVASIENQTYSKLSVVVDNSSENANQTVEMPAVRKTQDNFSVPQNGHRKFTFRKSSALIPSVAVKKATSCSPGVATGCLALKPLSERVNFTPSPLSSASKASRSLEASGQQLKQVQKLSGSYLTSQRPPLVQLGKPCFSSGSDQVAKNLNAVSNDCG